MDWIIKALFAVLAIGTFAVTDYRPPAPLDVPIQGTLGYTARTADNITEANPLTFVSGGDHLSFTPHQIRIETGTVLADGRLSSARTTPENERDWTGTGDTTGASNVFAYNDVWTGLVDVAVIATHNRFSKVVRFDSLVFRQIVPQGATAVVLDFAIDTSYTLPVGLITNGVELSNGAFLKPGRAWDSAGSEIVISTSIVQSGADLHLIKQIPTSWLATATFPVYTDADITIENTLDSTYYRESNCLRSLVWTSPTNGYAFWGDDAGSDLWYTPTTDGGSTWDAAVLVEDGNVARCDIWYDRWTNGDSGTEIHIVYQEGAGTEGIYYNSLDTADDSFGGEVTVEALGVLDGCSQWDQCALSITKARGGNLYAGYWTDASGGHSFSRSTDGGGTWGARTDMADGDEVDRLLLYPGGDADNQDIWAGYGDASAGEWSLKIYDDSGNSWSETSIQTGITFHTSYSNVCGATRHSDDALIFAFFNDTDTATADLEVFEIVSTPTITAKTDVITNEAGNVFCSVMINQQNDDIYMGYQQGTFGSSFDTVYQISQDDATSWDGEVDYSETSDDLRWLWTGLSVGDDGGKFQPTWHNDDLDELVTGTTNSITINAAGGARRRFIMVN